MQPAKKAGLIGRRRTPSAEILSQKRADLPQELFPPRRAIAIENRAMRSLSTSAPWDRVAAFSARA